MAENINIVRCGNSNACRLEFDKNNPEMAYFTFEGIERTGIVEHFFTTRLGGVSAGHTATLNFSYSQGDIKENVDENFRRAAAHFGMMPDRIACSQQTHTVNVRKVTALDNGKGVTRERDYTDVDGLITNERGIILATFYADCVPLFIVDPVSHAIGLSHSGWRGTAGKMGKVTLEHMAREFGTRAEDVHAAIAPSICQSCYEVSEDVALAFAMAFPENKDVAKEYLARHKSGREVSLPCPNTASAANSYMRDCVQDEISEQNIADCIQDEISEKDIADCLLYKKENGKYQLNLWYANYRVFRDAGVPCENIEVTDVCTCCNPELLFSHRASGGKRGNLGAFMMLK